MGKIFADFRDNPKLLVAILTAEGEKFFCPGWDLKAAAGGDAVDGDYGIGGFGGLQELPQLNKPVIGAINGYAMGGGFMLVERTDLRVAVKEAIFEMSEAKRWMLGGYNHGHYANLPHPVATEMALGFRFTAERLHQVGFINRLVEKKELLPTSIEMAEHILSLPPAARVNTIYMMREMAPKIDQNYQDLAEKLHAHGHLDDRMESRRAFAEKRKPDFIGWDNPEDRYNLPKLEK